MIKRLDHIATVVRNLDEALEVYAKVFDLKPHRIETVPEQGVKAALLPVGDGEIELLEPIDPESGVAKFLERRGEGLHHICLEVDDIEQELKHLKSKGVELIDKEPRSGLAGRVAFIHPRSAKGVLIELAQKV